MSEFLKKLLSQPSTEEEKKDDVEIDIDNLLLESRQVFLHGLIDDKITKRINKELLGLSYLNDEPIAMWINSPGGSTQHTFSIIDTMRGLTCPVYTFICGSAFSGAGMISIAGHKRVMTTNSSWMMHDMWSGRGDYFAKLENQHVYTQQLHKRVFNHLRKYTKLTDEEIQKCISKDLWLWPTKCKKKGIVDLIAKV